MTPRYDALRRYFLEITKDLIERGKIRQKRGQSLNTIMHAELATILVEVQTDLSKIAGEIGAGLVSASTQLIGSFIGKMLRR